MWNLETQLEVQESLCTDRQINTLLFLLIMHKNQLKNKKQKQTHKKTTNHTVIWESMDILPINGNKEYLD